MPSRNENDGLTQQRRIALSRPKGLGGSAVAVVLLAVALVAGGVVGSAGRPAFANGKVERLDDWLAERAKSLTGSTFYSDSINDLPLLEAANHAVVVHADARLAAIAAARGWRTMNLSGTTPGATGTP